MNDSKTCRQRRVLAVLMGVALAGAVLVGAEPQTIELSDLSLVVDLSDPRISPDGRWIAVLARQPDYDENKFVNRLALVDASSGTRRPLSSARPNNLCRS